MSNQEPVGYRDVWWCYHLNEPMIITYDAGGAPVCVHCNQNPTSDLAHTYMLHLTKPEST